MPRKPQQQRAKATVSSIVEAAMIVLAKEGPQGVTTRKIADVAGIGVGSLYEYFANREQVYDAIFAQLVQDAVKTIQPLIPELVRLPIREAVRSLLLKLRELLMENDGRYLKCVRYAPHLAQRNPLEPLRKVLTELLMQYVMRHPEYMKVPNLATMGYIHIHGGTFTVIRHLADPSPPMSFEELADGLADMVSYCAEGGLRDRAAGLR
jgi:AcrR family transcriptional regulator